METRDTQPAKRVRSTSKTLQEKLTYLCIAKQKWVKDCEFLTGIGDYKTQVEKMKMPLKL